MRKCNIKNRTIVQKTISKHHVGRTPLVDLPNLYLRDLGIQKWLLEEWLGIKNRKNRQAKLGRQNIKRLEEAFKLCQVASQRSSKGRLQT